MGKCHNLRQVENGVMSKNKLMIVLKKIVLYIIQLV